jgi:hypothetical protein
MELHPFSIWFFDNNNERSNLADVARKAGTARMNRLLYDVAGSASLDSLKWIVEWR